jgi:hypothetical protein
VRTRLVSAALVAFGLALGAPSLASAAPSDEDEVRVRGVCSPGHTIELRVRADDDELRIQLRIRSRARGERWTVVVVHERRVVLRVAATTGSGRSLRIRTRVPDFYGRDIVLVRATGPGAAACNAEALVVPDS